MREKKAYKAAPSRLDLFFLQVWLVVHSRPPWERDYNDSSERVYVAIFMLRVKEVSALRSIAPRSRSSEDDKMNCRFSFQFLLDHTNMC